MEREDLPEFLLLWLWLPAGFAGYPTPFRLWLVDLIRAARKGGKLRGWFASFIVAGMVVLAFWLPEYLFCWNFTLDISPALGWVVSGFDWYAGLTGAV